MAEQPDDKSEEKAERDPAGEAQGYICLDQAWSLALEYARDHREFYGRYAGLELSWDFISADETEDNYEIGLSYRAAGNFRTDGIEKFNVDKTGAIKSRRIVRQPRLSPGFIAASVILVLLAVMGAIFGGLWATATQDTTNATVATNVPAVALADFPTPLATTVSITPETLARLVAPNGQVTIDLDANTVDVSAQLAYVAVSTGDIPALPANFTATGNVFELTTETRLLKPITITVALTTVDTALAAGNADNIVIQHHTGGVWTQLDTLVDFRASTATAKVDRLSLFALTVLEPDSTPAPIPTPVQLLLPTATLAPVVKPAVSPPAVSPPAISPPAIAAPTVVPKPLPPVVAPVNPMPTPVPVPAAVPVRLPTPTPIPYATPVLVQDWSLENALVTGDKVTVFVRILGPALFDITLDGEATYETIIDGSLRADIFRNVPPGSHMVRVITVGVQYEEDFRSLKVIPPTPTLAPTPTAIGPPTPIPIYRIFVNDLLVPDQNRLMYTDAGTVTIS